MKFTVRRRVRSAAVFLVALGGFFVFGLVMLFVDQSVGVAFSLFGGLFFLLILVQALRLGWGYEVSAEGIAVKRTLRRHRLPRGEIAAVEAVDGQ